MKFAIEALFVDEGLVSRELFDDFTFAMKTRERADYSYIYNLNLAKDLLKSAENLLIQIESLI